jgi:hypothetical protein
MIREKYFYTVLFLDNYCPNQNNSSSNNNHSQVENPILKNFSISETTSSQQIYWESQDDNSKVLNVSLASSPSIKLPVTIELWNNENEPIFYCPILKEKMNAVTYGQITIENKSPGNGLVSFSLIFNEGAKTPVDQEKFTLAVKTLPSFDTKSDRVVNKDAANINYALDELLNVQQVGLAIVFRRNSLDAHFDLICDFDESYLHSLAQGADFQYLTRLSKYKNVKWLTKYTDNMQDIMDEINMQYYNVKFSWKENGTQWWNDDPYNYQTGHGPF